MMIERSAHMEVSSAEQAIWKILESVPDPEVPVLSVLDLGIIRQVNLVRANETDEIRVEILITPTYSGCPAIDAISLDIQVKLAAQGYSNTRIIPVLSPAWTTAWMTEAGKEKLKAYGIAPPNPLQLVCEHQRFAEAEAVPCPLCDSYHTRLISRFGSTACKAHYQCLSCQEPFDYFKCH